MFGGEDKYLGQSAEDAVRPVLDIFKPLFQRLFNCRVQFYWLVCSMPASVFVFLVNTRLFGELTGDYSSASAFSFCLGLLTFFFSNYLRRRFTYVPPSLIASLEKAMKEAEAANCLLEIPTQYAFDDIWLKLMRVRPREGIMIFRSRMEDAIKEIIKPRNPALVAGKHRLIDLIKYVDKEKLVSSEVANLLKELRDPLNRVVHGGETDPVLVSLLERDGMRLLLTLEQHR